MYIVWCIRYDILYTNVYRVGNNDSLKNTRQSIGTILTPHGSY